MAWVLPPQSESCSPVASAWFPPHSADGGIQLCRTSNVSYEGEKELSHLELLRPTAFTRDFQSQVSRPPAGHLGALEPVGRYIVNQGDESIPLRPRLGKHPLTTVGSNTRWVLEGDLRMFRLWCRSWGCTLKHCGLPLQHREKHRGWHL